MIVIPALTFVLPPHTSAQNSTDTVREKQQCLTTNNQAHFNQCAYQRGPSDGCEKGKTNKSQH